MTKYTPETFFQEYINFKTFCNLRRCGVIPVQSYHSHICPQLPGLGLTSNTAGAWLKKGTVSPVYNWVKIIWLDRPWLTHQAIATFTVPLIAPGFYSS